MNTRGELQLRGVQTTLGEMHQILLLLSKMPVYVRPSIFKGYLGTTIHPPALFWISAFAQDSLQSYHWHRNYYMYIHWIIYMYMYIRLGTSIQVSTGCFTKCIFALKKFSRQNNSLVLCHTCTIFYHQKAHFLLLELSSYMWNWVWYCPSGSTLG